MKKIQRYFDQHFQHHAYSKDAGFYLPIINKIIEVIGGKNAYDILDMGCGNGSFISRMLDSRIKANCVGIDLSESMIKMSKMNVGSHEHVSLLVSSGLNLPLKEDIKFDVIHIDSVLHHLIGRRRSTSRKYAVNLLDILTRRLCRNGVLVVEEMYYNSFVIPSFSSSIIFYALKVLNSLRLDLSRLTDEIALGLEVNFFSEAQLVKLLSAFGKVLVIKRQPAPLKSYKKLFLLKEFGHITFMVLAVR